MNPASFLEEIIARPDDDTPRLVCADWFEDNGDPDRAEFIRAQIERAKLAPGDDRDAELRDREEALLTAHRPRWDGPLSDLACETVYRRGFVEAVAPKITWDGPAT